jgi:hypothetical protein
MERCHEVAAGADNLRVIYVRAHCFADFTVRQCSGRLKSGSSRIAGAQAPEQLIKHRKTAVRELHAAIVRAAKKLS